MTTTAKITWYAVSMGERLPLKGTMAGVGYDATCTCGWDSRTGGATRRAVTDAVKAHKVEHELGFIN